MPGWDVSYGFQGRFRFEMEAERIAAAHLAPASLDDPRGSIAGALAHPLEYPPLEQCVVPGDRIVLVLDRHTPCSAELIAELWSGLAHRGVQATDVSILQPADFRGPSPGDPRTALPENVRSDISWVVHDPTRSGDCAYLASTASGERVYLARAILDADVVIPIGGLGYDPLLGYRGTHSVFYPGLSDIDAMRKAVGQGHDELTPDDARPLRQVIDEVAWLIGSQFVVQVIPGSGSGIAEVIAGQADAVLKRGRQRLNKLWRMDVSERPELVIAAVEADAAGHRWSQIATALDTARRIVARDGRVLLLTELAEPPSDGIKLISECRAARDALQPLRTAAPPDLVSATQLAHAIDWTNVYLLSRLDSQLVEDLFMIPLGGVDEALRLISGDERCAIVGGAQHTSVRLLEQTSG
ncbi:MAG: DUF2088 domain-containing protein [Planctomycetaceae bacterium]|nr:DUF2088 domain-containing protein [Planctomycetaceae bacterium]